MKLEQFTSLHYTTFSLLGNSIRRQLNGEKTANNPQNMTVTQTGVVWHKGGKNSSNQTTKLSFKNRLLCSTIFSDSNCHCQGKDMTSVRPELG